MDRLIGILELLKTLPPVEAIGWVAAGNVAVFLLVLACGHALLLAAPGPVPQPPPVRLREALLAAGCVAANILVTEAGVLLWKADLLRLRTDMGWWTVADVLFLLATMDGLMYGLHRVAHHPLLYPWLHRPHHVEEIPRPLTLFVMNPLETLGFGAVWLALITVYPPTWLGLFLYIGLNLAFGMIGHLGVEFTPKSWRHLPGLRWISTATFHGRHHRHEGHNLGFYTVIWDRLFGTLAPDDGMQGGMKRGRGSDTGLPTADY